MKLHEKINNARRAIEHKAGAIKRPYGRFLARQEVRLKNRVVRRFKGQLAWILEEAAKMTAFEEAKGVKRVERKTYLDEISDLVDGIPYADELVDDIVIYSSTTYKKGVTKGINELDMGKFGISFDIVNEEAVAYLKRLKDLQLSNFKGTISRNTKDTIKRILTDSVEKGESYQEVARLIRDQSKAGVFSTARAQLIATNQIGTAYGQGNQDIVDAFVAETHLIVQKAWQTVEDDRVTEECAANEDVGWLGNTEAFPSGDEQAPRASNPRCRCVTKYRTVDSQGNPT